MVHQEGCGTSVYTRRPPVGQPWRSRSLFDGSDNYRVAPNSPLAVGIPAPAPGGEDEEITSTLRALAVPESHQRIFHSEAAAREEVQRFRANGRRSGVSTIPKVVKTLI